MELIHSSADEPRPFTDPERTLDGSPRARVALRRLTTLWFNTGTLCNLTCENCYIESSPTNDRLIYLALAEFERFLAEIERLDLPVEEFGYTGGEPFMNPDFMAMLTRGLDAGRRALVLTNAMKPMQQYAEKLCSLRDAYGDALRIRVSVDHFHKATHQQERGRGSWLPMMRGLKWLSDERFTLDVAGRTRWGEDEVELRAGFAALFAREGIAVDAHDPEHLILFPEMDPAAEVSEITADCFRILSVSPDTLMCASSRMVVHERGAPQATVVACTLLPHDPRFDTGPDLADALAPVALNHVHCAKFCVLGGGSCTG